MNSAAWSLSDNFSGLSLSAEFTDAVGAAPIYVAESTAETWPQSEPDRYHAGPRSPRDDEDEEWEDDDYEDEEDWDEDEDWDDEDEDDEDEDWDDDDEADEDWDDEDEDDEDE